MKIQSNIPIPQSQKWLNEQLFVAINHRDNGVQPEGEEGKRYEADFTVAENDTEEAVLYAFERSFNDAPHDRKVIDKIEVDGVEAIKVKKFYPDTLPKIKAVDVITDNELKKEPDVISSDKIPVDMVIQKVAGKVKNYVVDVSAGARTTATDADVNKLIEDGNIIITAE